MCKVIGHMTPKQIQTNTRIRSLLINRKVKTHGKLIGGAVVTDIKGLPYSFARCNIYISSNGLYASRNGVYIRSIGQGILKDKSFQKVA